MDNKKILELYRKAKTQQDPMKVKWKELQQFVMPEIGQEKQIFDSTGSEVAENLATAMFKHMISADYIHLESDTNTNGARLTAQSKLRKQLVASNFFSEVKSAYLELVVNGTACLFLSETPIGSHSEFNFVNLPIKDISILRDNNGQISSVFHTVKMAACEIKDRYPSWAVPTIFENAIKNNPRLKLPFVQSVIKDNDKFQFTAWVNINNEVLPVSTGVFETNPYIVFRWCAVSNELYGRSPVMRVLPDIKVANKVVELILKNAVVAVSGIWQADDDGVINLSKVNLTPGAIVPKAVGSSGLTPLSTNREFDVSQLILSDLRARIKSALSGNVDTTIHRIKTELIVPVVERSLSILSRRGLIEKMPGDLRINYKISEQK